MRNAQLTPLEERDRVVAPVAYWDCENELRDSITNGCGPGGWKVDLVPDRIYGLNVHQACDVHDWMYYWGESSKDKTLADRTFHTNLRSIIDRDSVWVMKPFRFRRARVYYEAVHLFGGPAFWKGKRTCQ